MAVTGRRRQHSAFVGVFRKSNAPSENGVETASRVRPGYCVLSTSREREGETVMDTGSQMQQDEGWGVQGPEWTRLHSLLELVKREHRMEELSPERREQIRERVLERLDQIE